MDFNRSAGRVISTCYRQETMNVVVLDMDETLGVFQKDMFHVRPRVDFLIKMLRCMGVDIILWSLGDDDYVQRVVNSSLPLVALHAYKIFARSEAKVSHRLYGYAKAGEHIRQMYEEEICLIGVDDQVNANMNSNYDLRIRVKPYKKPDKKDRVLLNVCESIVDFINQDEYTCSSR